MTLASFSDITSVMTICVILKTVENPSQIQGIQMVNIAHTTSPAIEIKCGSFIWSSSLNNKT